VYAKYIESVKLYAQFPTFAVYAFY